jgi:hypothetical protein
MLDQSVQDNCLLASNHKQPQTTQAANISYLWPVPKAAVAAAAEVLEEFKISQASAQG